MIFDQINLFFLLLFSAALGFAVNTTYQKLGYEWAANKNQKIIALLLAPITLIITKTIAENLALSLGMIGALSIIRFRNPVKSPLELVIYFVYITIGISSGVNIYYSIILTIFVIAMPIILKIKFITDSKLFNNNNVGTSKYYLNIELKNEDSEEINSIKNKINSYGLISKFYDNENNITSYTILVNKEESENLGKELENLKSDKINYNLSIQNDGE